MTAISKSTQLSTFEVIRTILRTDDTLNSKFSVQDYYEFDPQVKALDFNSYPYMIVSVPETEDQKMFVGDLTYEQEFTVNITMVNEFRARGTVTNLMSALLAKLQGATEDIRDAGGYEFVSINLIGQPEVTSINQKQVIVTLFELTLTGEVKI